MHNVIIRHISATILQWKSSKYYTIWTSVCTLSHL